MTDAAVLPEWQAKYESWRAEALPRMAKGETKEAFASYPWFSAPGDPFAKLAKPVSESRFALVTTGGYSIEGEQQPFTGLPAFDDSAPEFKIIPADVDREKLRIHHVGYDHRFAKEDINVNLPLDRLRELEAAGEIGSIAPDTEVLMGLIPNVVPLVKEVIPQLVAKFQGDGVEAALLVPS